MGRIDKEYIHAMSKNILDVIGDVSKLKSVCSTTEQTSMIGSVDVEIAGGRTLKASGEIPFAERIWNLEKRITELENNLNK